jgi:hypothetical protein
MGTYVIESLVCDLGDDRGGILGKGGNRDYGGKMKIEATKSGTEKCWRVVYSPYGCFYGCCIVFLCTHYVCAMSQPDKGSI